MTAMSRSESDCRLVLIGIPESSRILSFCEAADALGWPATQVHSWAEILPDCALAAHGDLIRLDSPGRNWTTEAKLLLLGWSQSDPEDPAGRQYTRIAPEEIATFGEPAGRIVAMRQWYLGWQSALTRLAENQPGARFWNAPAAIAQLFDKEACQRRLESVGCPMPATLGIPTSFDDLVERMRTHRRARIFLKSCHSSSASGIAALESGPRGFQAFSTTLLVERNGRQTLWNSRPGKLYRSLSEIRTLVDALCRQRTQAQVWLPKLGWAGHRIDFRVVTIAGRAAHTVLRMSRTPFTNLQLRNHRGNLTSFAEKHPDLLARVRAVAEQAASAFPDCFTLGVDVALSPSGRAYVLEANAFGDHLPGCLFEGSDPYTAQLRAWATSRQAERSRLDRQNPPSMRPPDGRSSSSAERE